MPCPYIFDRAIAPSVGRRSPLNKNKKGNFVSQYMSPVMALLLSEKERRSGRPTIPFCQKMLQSV
ncbi:MAG: hypothetical protein AB4352_20510 [Hormoscilla sp.]